jgi:hypothetical protein
MRWSGTKEEDDARGESQHSGFSQNKELGEAQCTTAVFGNMNHEYLR